MLIFEIINPSVLYHGTSIDGLMQIIATGEIRGSQVDNGPAGVSLTRDVRIAREKAMLRGKGNGAVLVFDRAVLRAMFGRRLRPIDVLHNRGGEPGNPFAGYGEAEERLAGNIPTRLIASIVLTDPNLFRQYQVDHPDMQPALTALQSFLKQ